MTAAEKAYTQMMGEGEGKDKYYNKILSGKDPETLYGMARRGKAAGDMGLYARASQEANEMTLRQAMDRYVSENRGTGGMGMSEAQLKARFMKVPSR